MAFRFRTFTFEDCYCSVRSRITVDEAQDSIKPAYNEPSYVRNRTDGNILDAVLYIYVSRPFVKTPREVAGYLQADARELSAAIHLLTGMSHEDLLHQYRLRSICEVLRSTRLTTTTIAHYFGYSSLMGLNQFLLHQTGLTANEIREGRDPKSKTKRPAWWKK